jgi:hypothetical protein
MSRETTRDYPLVITGQSPTTALPRIGDSLMWIVAVLPT